MRARSVSSGATAQSLHASSRWILTSWQDLVLFVGTPLLIIPAFLAAQARWKVEDLSLFVASFGAIGHHLPGMLRAYGDRALFQRFRWRFSIAPAFLAATCLVFALRDLNGIVLVVYFWGVWHGLMQTYGFLRIYDAKAGPSSSLTARLDHAMCVTWFATAVLVSPSRMTNILSVFYTSGGPLIETSTIETLRTTSITLTGVVTVAFLLHAAWLWHRGHPCSSVKLLLMVTSFGFFWYANVFVRNLLVGIALFEVFHDVQYLSIVWIFNLNRVQKDPGVGAFTRFLFRRNGALVGAYVGLVVAYGSLNLVSTAMSAGLLRRTLTGLLAASALLHFYYDGFIWKVRERATRQSLGLSGGTPEQAPAVRPAWLIHGAKWSLFVLPVFTLGLAELQGRAPELDRARAIAQAAPASAAAQEHFGTLLAGAGRIDEAVGRLREAVRLDSDNAAAQSNLGFVLGRAGQLDEAVTHYREAIRIEPGDALTLTNLGNALSRLGEFPAAIRHFEEALRISPNRVDTHIDLGAALLKQGALDEAIDHFREALRISPNQSQALANLALARELRDRRSAIPVDQQDAHQHAAPPATPSILEIAKRSVSLRTGVGSAHDAVSTSSNQAQAFYDQGLAYVHSYVWLEAARSFNQALTLDPQLAAAHAELSLAYSELNAPAAARAAFNRAKALAPSASDHDRRHIALRELQMAAEAAPDDAAKLTAYRQALDQAVTPFPKDVELWLLRGMAESADPAERGQGSVDASIAFYEKARALAPAHVAADHYLAHAYENTNRTADALAHAAVYAKAASSVPHARHMHGHSLRRAGRIQEAIAEFVAADALEQQYLKAEKVPAEFDWHYQHNLDLLASSYQYLGQMAKAESLLKASFAIPSSLLAQEFNKREWPEFLLARGRVKEAGEAATEMAGHRNGVVSAAGHVEIGRVKLALGQFQAAADESNSALRLMRGTDGAGRVADALKALQGEFFLRTGQRDKARPMFEDEARSVRAAPGPDAWVQALFTLEAIARAARDVGDWDLAAWAARQMIEHDPNYAGSHYALALAAQHAGDQRTAAAEFALAGKYWSTADADLPELKTIRQGR